MDDSDYRDALKRYALDTLRDIERHINRERYPERWDWLQEEVGNRLRGIPPLPAPEIDRPSAEPELYAGFLSRTVATAIDTTLIFLPLSVWFGWSLTVTPPTGLLMVALVPILFPLYNLVCLRRWGQTLGKRIAGIQVVGMPGEPLRSSQLVMRHLPDVLLGLGMMLNLVSGVHELVDAGEAGPLTAEQFHRLLPNWDRLDDLWDLWIWSECLVILGNRTRRGLHDYLGATWVIHAARSDRFLLRPPTPFRWRASVETALARGLQLARSIRG